MKLITLNVPESYLDALDRIVKKQFYPNRSDAIRAAIRDLVRFHLGKEALRVGQK